MKRRLKSSAKPKKPSQDEASAGQRLRELREAAGMNQVELADRIGTDKSSICNWEHGKYLPGLASARKLADALGVTVDELLPARAS